MTLLQLRNNLFLVLCTGIF